MRFCKNFNRQNRAKSMELLETDFIAAFIESTLRISLKVSTRR
jgi:hypothetical protein